MSIAKNKIIETRKRLKEQKEKDELKLKAIQQRLMTDFTKVYHPISHEVYHLNVLRRSVSDAGFLL